jgi:hypothetical protein
VYTDGFLRNRIPEETAMTLTPTAIRRIATDVVTEYALPFDVVAAWRSLRKSPYIEIVLRSWERDASGRVFLGVNDWMSESQIRHAIIARLYENP